MSSQKFPIKQALEIIRGYAFQAPLHLHLKEVFKANKQMGSRDRRWLREIIFCWYRLGNALKDLPDDERLIVAFFLVHHEDEHLAGRILTDDVPFKMEQLTAGLSEKIEAVKKIYPQFNESELFPFGDWVSEGLDINLFCRGMLSQPKVWLRAKTGKSELVQSELRSMNIPYETTELSADAIAIQQQENVRETFFFKSGDVEIQDLSSQLTGNYFHAKAGESWYDCCAASGGKSLLLHSKEPNVLLTVSDSRKTVLQNLKERFERGGIESYFSYVVDLEKPLTAELKGKLFDGIILDVPCSGSGTWGRNPEHIQQCTLQKILDYSNRQKQIALTVSSLLKPGGKLIYITCSVFKMENENILEYLTSKTKLKVQESKLIQGTELGADSMFVANLKME